jgi:hypothetical protein
MFALNIDGYRVREAIWLQDFKYHAPDIAKKFEVDENKLHEIIDELIEMKILPDRFEYY